jgi:hypothetical protein
MPEMWLALPAQAAPEGELLPGSLYTLAPITSAERERVMTYLDAAYHAQVSNAGR